MNGAETSDRSEGEVISSMLIAIWGTTGIFYAPTIKFQQSGSYLLCYSLVAPKHASEQIISGRAKAVGSAVKMPMEKTTIMDLTLAQLSNSKRLIWSLDNDRTLYKAVESCKKGRGGCYDWVTNSKKIASKTPRQCQDRFRAIKKRRDKIVSAKNMAIDCRKSRVEKRAKYETLSAPNSKICKYLSKHDMQFVSETLVFHVTVESPPLESPPQTDDIVENEVNSDSSHLDALSDETESCSAPCSATTASNVCYLPKSNSLFVGQPPAVLKKLCYIFLTIHQFKSEIFGHIKIDFCIWDLFSAVVAEDTCPILLMTLQLQLLAPLVTELTNQHEVNPEPWRTPENFTTDVFWPEKVRQVCFE